MAALSTLEGRILALEVEGWEGTHVIVSLRHSSPDEIIAALEATAGLVAALMLMLPQQPPLSSM
jgi:hypothetical protein